MKTQPDLDHFLMFILREIQRVCSLNSQNVAAVLSLITPYLVLKSQQTINQQTGTVTPHAAYRQPLTQGCLPAVCSNWLQCRLQSQHSRLNKQTLPAIMTEVPL